MEKRQRKGSKKASMQIADFLNGGDCLLLPPPPSESYNYNEKNEVEKPPHGENEAKITPYNGKKIFLIFQGRWGRLSASSCTPPRAPMVVFPLVEFAKALISPKILVHAHACDQTNM